MEVYTFFKLIRPMTRLEISYICLKFDKLVKILSSFSTIEMFPKPIKFEDSNWHFWI